MNWSTSVYTTLSSDTEPSIVITFDSAKYIFNAGENTTRTILQNGRGWKKVKGLFLTQLGTRRSSGLSGLLMSVADSSPRVMEIIGPSGLLHFLASMRFYVFRNTLGLKVAEIPDFKTAPQSEAVPVFKDDNITVFSIPINVSKRKRESSPELPSKRTFLELTVPAVDGPSIWSTDTPLLDRFSDDPKFDPAALEGDEAEAWRQLIIERMFTWIEPPRNPRPTPKPQNKKAKRGQNAGDIVTPETPPSQVEASLTSLPQVPHWVEDTPKSQGRLLGRASNGTNITGSLKPLPAFTSPTREASTAYIVVGPHFRGKFDVKRAEELGLQGPLRGRVARGETVTFTVDNGAGEKVQRTVRPEDCIGEQETAKAVIILDVPTQDHIESLISAFNTPAYSPFRVKQPSSRKDCVVHVIYHLLGPNILEDERYKSFMNGFSDDTQHIISSPDHDPDPLTFTSAGLSQLRLSQLDSEMFPLPHWSSTPRKDLTLVTQLPPQSSFMKSNIHVDVRPPRRAIVDPLYGEKDKFHPAMAADMPPELSQVTKEKFTKAKRIINSRMETLDSGVPNAGDEVVVIPLGTSSAISTRYRNVSSQLVRIPDWGNLLLDTGEGTWGQMARYFGTDPARPSNVWGALRELKCIFISHAHADHHVGLARILAMRKQVLPRPSAPEPLYLVSILPVHLYLRDLAHLEDLGLSDSTNTENGIIPIISDVLNPRGRYQNTEAGWRGLDHSRKAAQMLCQALGLQRLNAIDVLHRTKAFGLVMTHQDGWRLVYSGDTMPSNALAQAGEGATLLIHEATMGDDQEEMARAKAHSTISQAIDVAKRMRAQNVLLTHFSSRYPTMPRYFASASTDGGPTVGLAMDHACMRIGDLWKMATYIPAIEQSFRDIPDEGDEEEEAMIINAIE
ncbi:hypothetical protein BC826DRAFT_1017511 [Russula brevipes]|nr:hypothetical protein BC826DRAFT_1017511 [Russula brevipes]